MIFSEPCHSVKFFGRSFYSIPNFHYPYFSWKNWTIRGIFAWLMIGIFCIIVYGGPLALMITVRNIFVGFKNASLTTNNFQFQTLIVQVKCFQEIINIGYAVYRIHGLPWFRSLSWYFLITSNYFFYGENLMHYFTVVINQTVIDFSVSCRASHVIHC